ncbi:UV radiation resistance associated protein-like isoform X1 [Limulus polyphemus]|uniref:UV radiation resistance associated protein-like isoform X1 n=2 Tax=Limulus polyphemus TaxID=6850 RepID=A0ABM1TM72_LIMPO|nr:UV radiation resistance associated protein-like isoform X1 [Limulus polyphemus]XP_022256978.1 UV radiation resistance associated protein-like isoform X1 [Limulus polyphemus]
MSGVHYQFDTRIRRQHVPLVTHQHRLRHLRSVCARNVQINFGSNEGSGLYFTLHQDHSASAFYTSELVQEYTNPTWKHFEMLDFASSTNAAALGFVIRLRYKTEEQDSCMIEWTVHLTGLVFISELIPKESKKFKSNTLLFGLSEGYYSSSDSIQDSFCEGPPNKPTEIINVDPSTVRVSYSVNTLSRIQTIHRAIKQTQAAAQRLRVLIEDKLQQAGQKHQLKGHQEQMKARVSTLRNELQVQQYRLNTLLSRRSLNGQEVEEKAVEIMNKLQLLKRERDALVERRRCYFESRENLLKTNAQLILRRKQLISELSCIYPIVEFPDKRGYSICGVHLPNSEDFAGRDDTMISNALGYVCHLTLMISQFLNLPLRYPVRHFSSRSVVIDHVSDKIPDKNREFPLYAKGKERLHFNYGVYLLNKNIAQLRHYCGMTTHDLRATLLNLHTLVETRFNIKNDQSQPEVYSTLSLPRMPSFHSFPLSLSGNVTDPSLGVQHALTLNESMVEKQNIEVLKNDPQKISNLELIAGLKKEMEFMKASNDSPKRTGPDLSCTAVSSSLDKGLNDIITLQKTLENNSHQSSKKLSPQIKSLNYSRHSSVPNLTSCTATVSFQDGVLKQTTNQKQGLNSALKMWMGGSSQGNSDEEFAAGHSPSSSTDSSGQVVASSKQPWIKADSKKELLPHCDDNNCDQCRLSYRGTHDFNETAFDADLKLRTQQLAVRSNSFRMQWGSSCGNINLDPKVH